MLSFILTALSFSSLALASPLVPRADGCVGVPGGTGNNANFTLQAYVDIGKSLIPLGLVSEPGISPFNLVIGVRPLPLVLPPPSALREPDLTAHTHPRR